MSDKPLTQEELMIQYFNDEELRIKDLDLESEDDDIRREGYIKLCARIKQIEAIAFEAKARAVRLTSAKRKVDAKNPSADWLKASKTNELADPRKASVKKAEKTALTKLEKLVAGFVSLDYSDDDILDAVPTTFKRGEVWDAINKARGRSPLTNSPELQANIDKAEAEEKAEADKKREANKAAAKEYHEGAAKAEGKTEPSWKRFIKK